MVEKELGALDQQMQSKITDYITFYQTLTEINKHDCKQLNEYDLPKLTPQWFTYHKKKDPKTGKYLDDGKCTCCGKDRQYLLIRPGIPPICEKCYTAARGYRKLLFDPLRLKSKRDLTVADCKKIVKYMDKYAKKKLVALAAAGAMLAIDLKK